MANWVKESWDAIDPNIIKRSFKYCGVSNAIDGSKDDLIFDLSKIANTNNPGRGVEEEEDDNSDKENDSDCELEDSELEYYERNEN
ncbi:unnamed protein product [Rhizophagus irregularis]|nr:unnamed protein product [Rhizophagus irregularis]